MARPQRKPRSRREPSEVPTVAVLVKRGKVFEAEPAFGDGQNVFVGRKSLDGAAAGDLVVLRPSGRGRAEVVRRLGRSDSLPAIMEAILADNRVPRGFSSKALAEAEARSSDARAADTGRHDLTGLIAFTIDPDEARDFDDAISLVPGPGAGELTLYVHIADVSYFVAAGSRLDREAAKKACSVYLPIMVEPMLPALLSSDVCSLRPGQERKCVTVEMVFRKTAVPGKAGGAKGAGGQAAPDSAADLREVDIYSETGKAGSKERGVKKGRGRAAGVGGKRGRGRAARGRAARRVQSPEVYGPAHEPFTPAYERVKATFYRSLIRSRQRLTYNQVDDLFGVPEADSPAAHEGRLADMERRGIASIRPEVGELLQRCRELSGAMREARYARGALNITTFEPEFRIGADGEVLGVRARIESESHALIEEFMIAANEAVADFLGRRQSDCIYRVHEEPDAMAVDALFDMLDELGIPVPDFSLETGTPERAALAIRQLIASLPRVLAQLQRSRSAFGEIVLRSLKQARYYEENLGHFGLASPAYLHFTSPIRRYPDLVVHRALLRELNLEQYSCSRLELAQTAQASSESERRAAMMEHRGDDVVLAFLLDRLLFEEGWDRVFEGEVIGLINAGLFVRFERAYEGFLPARRLWGDYFSLNEKGGMLIGRRSGRSYRLGDRMSIRVVKIDKLRGKVELEPAKG